MSSLKVSTDEDETFMCIICMESPNERLMCRHCCKFICQPCTDTLFTNQETPITCPHCRRLMQRSDFSRINWLSDHLDQVQRRLQETTVDKCVEHGKEEASLFCLTCSAMICACCIAKVFRGKHVYHDYYQREDAYRRVKDTILKKIQIAVNTSTQAKLKVEEHRQAIHSIRRCQAERSQEITELCASMNERVRQQANEHTEKLEGPYKVITEQLSEYDRVISRITQMINTKSEVELITQHRMLSGALSKLPSISIPLENTILSSSLSSPAGCAWQTGEFSIDHFSTKQANGHILVSEEYRLEHNQQWSLFVYPNGFRLQYGLGLSVFLKLISGFEEPIHYRFTIEMLHSSGNSASNCTRTDTRIFKAGWRNGWTFFIPLADLRAKGFVCPNTDTIKFRFHVHTATMIDQMTLLQWYLKKTQSEIREAKDEIHRVTNDRDHLKKKTFKQNEEINELLEKQADLKGSVTNQRENEKQIAIQHEQITRLKRDNADLKMQLDVSKARSKYHNEDSRHSSDSSKRARFS